MWGGSPGKSFRIIFSIMTHKPKIGEMVLEKDRAYLMYTVLFQQFGVSFGFLSLFRPAAAKYFVVFLYPQGSF